MIPSIGTAALLLSACASSGLPRGIHPTPVDPLTSLVRESPLGASPDHDIMALGPARAWLAEQFGPGRADHPAALHRLTAMLSLGGDLDLQYHPLAVHGAENTFRAREGNCLSQTTLFVALARALGMRAYFREVYQTPDWIEQGDLRIKNRHVAARVHINEWGTWEVDFGEAEADPKALGRSLSDLEARAHHFNNLGAAALARDADEDAVRHFNRALLLAPRLAFGWANLGTAYIRLGQAAEAEAALREAARLDPHEVVALTALERLYVNEGARDLAAEMRRRVEQARFQNPFIHYDQGLLALQKDRPKAAVKHLEKALEGLPNLVQLRTDLGRAYYRAERLDRAKKTFREAHDLATTQDERNAVKQALISLTQKKEEAPTRLAVKSRKLDALRRARSGFAEPPEALESPTGPRLRPDFE